MATIASSVPTLLDVLSEIGPDGKEMDIAEILTQTNEIFDDMTWMEGNLVTGHRGAARLYVPEPEFRLLNRGVGFTKGASAQYEETTAMLEDFSKADRELARLSGNIAAYRVKQGRPHIQGFSNKMARHVFYGNNNNNPAEFTGLGARYFTGDTSITPAAENVIDAGGTGSGLRSIWLVGWSHETCTGIYPKNTKAGLVHEDATPTGGDDGAGTLYDANGKAFMGYMDHWAWNCGLYVEDWRYVVRIANIDMDTLSKDADAVGSADLTDLLIQAAERIESLNGVRASFYMPRDLRTYFRRQIERKKGANLSWNEVGGKKVLMFDEIPMKRVDALNTEETAVTGF